MVEGMQVVRANKMKCLVIALTLSLLIGVILAVSSSGKPSAKKDPLVREETAAQRAYALFSGIPQDGTVLGNPRAPVTLQLFADLECPEVRQFMIGAFPFLVRRWVRSGRLRVRFRSTEDTETPGWFVFREQQAAALAAGEQHRMWNYAYLFYREQGREFTDYVTEAFLEGLARQAGVDVEAWGQEREPERWVPRIEADERLAKARGLKSVPAFLIGRTGGAARPLWHFSNSEPREFEEAIEGLL
jgi:protein-disulfide isomerase